MQLQSEDAELLDLPTYLISIHLCWKISQWLDDIVQAAYRQLRLVKP